MIAFAQTVAEGQNPDTIIWPGDVNNNGIVNHLDLLYLGASYDLQGPERDMGSIAWGGQDVAQDWPIFGNGLDAAFADCDGNGFIDENDLQGIQVNYGLVHDTVFPDTFPMGNVFGNTGITFDTTGVMTQVVAGQTVVVPINLGSANGNIENFYGLAFRINVNTDFIKLSSLSFMIDNNWIDPNDNGLLSLQKRNFGDTTFDVALSRKNMGTTGGAGTIGYLTFIIEDNVPTFAPNTEVLSFDDTRILDNNLNEIYHVDEGSLILDFTSPVQELPRSEFSIYPNPVNNGLCTIKGLENYLDAEVRLLDVTGREMKMNFVNGSFSVNHLPTGVYFININTSTGRLTEKIIINN